MSAAANNLGRATYLLAKARFSTRSGESLLYGASVLAAAVSATITFTTVAGTWMFWQRSAHPTGLHAALVNETGFETILNFYVGLASLACALVLPAVISLAVSGAQLGARGREHRSAALRLIGLSSVDVTKMALVDAAVQSVAGTFVGLVVYGATASSWERMTFQAVAIRDGEMWMPWWLTLTVALVLVGVSLASSAWGLRQVRISPLGVSHRANKPAARAWRLGAFVILVLVSMIVAQSTTALRGGTGLFMVAAVLALMIAGVNLLGPWILQLVARVVALAPWPTVMVAARRVIADPVATWTRVSTIMVLAFVGGFLATVPFGYKSASATPTVRAFMDGAAPDFVQGGVITVAFGFLLTSTSLLITQASATIGRAEQSRASYKMGFPAGFAMRVMWCETFGPLLLSTVLGGLAGVQAAMPLARQARNLGLAPGDAGALIGAVLVGGLGIAVLALSASHPLQRRLVHTERRRND